MKGKQPNQPGETAMQNFKSNIKSITEETLFQGFRAVIRDTTQSAYVAAGQIGTVEVKPGLSVLVYEGVNGAYVAQASAVIKGKTRLLASAEFDKYDF